MSWHQGLRRALAGTAVLVLGIAAGYATPAAHAWLPLEHAGPHTDLRVLQGLALLVILAGLIAATVGAIQMTAHRRRPVDEEVDAG